MAELADAHDSKSCGEIHVGSTPTSGTIRKKNPVLRVFYILNSVLITILFFRLILFYIVTEDLE